MTRFGVALAVVLPIVIALLLQTSEGRLHDVQGQGYHQTCEVFQKNPRGRTLSSLYNHNVAHFGRLLLNVLNWGDTYLQTSWCGSGGFKATILAPSNKALAAGFRELNRRFNMHADPLDYANPFPWQSGNDTPLALAIDAIAEAGMIPNMAINLNTDKRVPFVHVHSGKPHKYFEVHSSIANVNPGQILRFWRNRKDGRVYVYLPGGIMPGPYRVTTKTKRHVTVCKACQPKNDVYVYEVEGLLVPGTVALGLLYTPRPYKVKGLRPILRRIGPKGFQLTVPPNYKPPQ